MRFRVRVASASRAALAVGTVSALVLLSVAGCTSSPSSATGGIEAEVCGNLLGAASAAADPEKTGDHAAYGVSANLLEANFLYETMWGLKLSALRHSYPARLDKRATAKWLLQQIAAAQSDPRAQQGSSIDTIRDAVEGLAALGNADKVRGDPFVRFRSGWGYSETPGASPDLTSSGVAAEGLDALGVKPPSSLIEHVTARVPQISGTDSLTRIVDTDLSDLAVLASSDSRQKLLRLDPDLGSELTTWNRKVIASGPGGVQLGVLASLHGIAERIGLGLARPPHWWVTTLTAPGGFLALGKGGQGDPQVTYVAMKLGLLPRDALMPALDSGVTPSGWLIASRPSLESFYDISALHQICKAPLTGEQKQLAHWTKSVLGRSHPTSQSLYETCALRSIYRAPLAKAEQGRLARGASSDLATAEKNPSATPHELADAYIAARACGVRVRVEDLPVLAYSGGAGTTSLDCFGASVLGGEKSKSRYAAGIARFLARTRRGSDYLYNTAAGDVPDVYSTGLALDLLGASVHTRAKALTVFRSQGSWAVQVPDKRNPEPGASLGALLAFAFLISGTDSRELSPLFIT